jgi:hypothetical protein
MGWLEVQIVITSSCPLFGMIAPARTTCASLAAAPEAIADRISTNRVQRAAGGVIVPCGIFRTKRWYPRSISSSLIRMVSTGLERLSRFAAPPKCSSDNGNNIPQWRSSEFVNANWPVIRTATLSRGLSWSHGGLEYNTRAVRPLRAIRLRQQRLRDRSH